MTDLTDFLLARIAEDEGVARAATGEYGRWELDDADDTDPYEVAVFPERGGSTCIARTWLSAAGLGDAQHIARWDPARVLAECEAKRRIVAAELLREVGPASHYISAEVHAAITERTATPVLRLLALPYADHPDYREEWQL